MFDPDYDAKKGETALEQIQYRYELIIGARELLRSTRYYGLEILIDEQINPQILAILQDKYERGER